MIFLEQQVTFGMTAIAGLIVIAIGVTLALHGLTKAAKNKEQKYWEDWSKRFDGYEEHEWKKNVKR